jgi:hypothetical protein
VHFCTHFYIFRRQHFGKEDRDSNPR